MSNKVSLSMVIHSHQPVGNFDHVIEEAFQKSYRPFIEVLSRHPQIHLGLHFSGVLLRWIETQHPEFIRQLRDLTERGQVEHVGGGFYEPILAAIPDPEKITQVRRQSEFLRRRFGAAPRGAWVAERVWDQGLILPLVKAGVKYTILDDTHFLAAGLTPSALHQAYLTEESGSPLSLVPSLHELRYTIPFHDPEETLSILRGGIGQPHALFAVGDDCEKFGVWPGTYDHCYTNGWLERFFVALEGAADWLEVITVSDYLAKCPPAGLVYLPTASYAEMMAWALPADATIELEECVEETNHMPNGERFRRFLHGGQWRNFLAKYPESNQIQKLVLRASRRWRELHQSAPPGTVDCHMLHQAQDHLLAAQCNDAYWHGIFGGLYTPHLRSALLSHLIQAEQIMDGVEYAQSDSRVRVSIEDFDVDGCAEVLLDQRSMSLVVRPGDGGTVSSLRFKPARLDLINSLARRREAYHRVMYQKAVQSPDSGRLASIHDRMPGNEVDFSAALRYDRYARHAFRAYLFPRHKGWQEFDSLALEECGELAGGAWELGEVARETGSFELRKTVAIGGDGGKANVLAVKGFTHRADRSSSAITCNLALSVGSSSSSAPSRLGMEMVFNLLAPNSPDRYFVSGKDRHPLEFRGELAGTQLSLVDEWQHIEITLEAPGAMAWWVVPIETISQSESGFERVYQGSAIMAVWDVEIAQQREVSCLLRVAISSTEVGKI